MFSVRFYHSQNDTVLAVCDEELLGRMLREGKARLVVSDFYDGDRVDEEALPSILAKATNINLVGDRCIGIAMDNGFVNAAGVIRIEGVPHAMVFYI